MVVFCKMGLGLELFIWEQAFGLLDWLTVRK